MKYFLCRNLDSKPLMRGCIRLSATEATGRHLGLDQEVPHGSPRLNTDGMVADRIDATARAIGAARDTRESRLNIVAPVPSGLTVEMPRRFRGRVWLLMCGDIKIGRYTGTRAEKVHLGVLHGGRPEEAMKRVLSRFPTSCANDVRPRA